MLAKIFASLTIFIFLLTTNAPLAYAIPNPQDPSTEAIITIEADGIAPFDATSGPAVPGTDDTDTNDIVRNFDLITYNVEVSLNDADDTNVQAVITLNDKGSWQALAPECKTIAQGFNTISPDSNLQDNDGDGLNETMVCNLGDHTEGTKLLIKPVAQAVGNNTDMIQANVLSTSDNNVNTTGGAGTQGDGPVETQITASFGVNLTKSIVSLPDEDETDYTPGYKPADSIAPGSPEGKVIDWHINLAYNAGSEFIADNGGGTQDFTLTDTWVGTHSTANVAIEGDNANGDFDDQIVMLGTISGVPADNCELINATVGSVTCTQNGPGEPITIQITGVPVNQQPLAKVHLKMFVPYPDVFPAAATETYNIDNTVELTGWSGAGTMVTSATGATDPGPEVGVQDYLVSDTSPGPLAMYKSFDSLSISKSGQRAAARGEIIETTLTISDHRTYDTNPAICDTLDTSSFEFVGSIGAGQIDGIYHGAIRNSSFTNNDGEFSSVHDKNNPTLAVVSAPSHLTDKNGVHLDALQNGVIIEYSATNYATTGDDHWSATCEDDLDGDGSNDWVTDYTALPGGATDVVRVRMTWDRDASVMDSVALGNRSSAMYSFDLKIKETAPIGTYLPNVAATYDENNVSWLGQWYGAIGAHDPRVYFNVEDDSIDPLYSFNTHNADRVLVLPASMGITKVSNEGNALEPGHTASFTIDPRTSGSNASAVTMTFTDTLPAQLSYISDTCAADYAAVGLTCAAAVSGQTVTWTVANYQVGDDLPAFNLVTEVNSGTPSGTYTNSVTIGSDFATFTDDSHCASATDTTGTNTTDAVTRCENAFAAPHTAQASILVVTPSGYKVQKGESQIVVEPFTDFENTLSYTNLGGTDIGQGQIIDILPHNGDGQESTLRHNSDEPGNPNTATQTVANAANFQAITPSSAGETFEYSTDPYASIDHRPCHPSNWPAGDVLGGGNATLDAVCSEGLINPATDVPTATQAGTGATSWVAALPANIYDIKAVRISTPAFPAGETTRELTLELNSAASIDGDLFCNNFGANSDIVTLDVISNDVCIPVVAGSIGNYIWLDTNQDGIQDAGEQQLANVDVKLLDGTGNPIHWNPATGAIVDPADPNGTPYIVTTNADGEYLFENLPSGDYQVMVDTATLPAGSVQTYDYDGAGDNMSAITLAGPNTDPTLTDVDDNDEQDFGYYYNFDLALKKELATPGPYSPGGNITYNITVYNQGTVDATDIVITDQLPPHITPNDANWTDIGSNQATHTITSLPAGQDVTVTLTATIGVDATGTLINIAEISDAKDGDGNTPVDIDSTPDTDPGNDTQTDDVTDGSGGDEDDNDPAGITITPVATDPDLGSIGDYIWLDANRDGIQDAGEEPLAGITVTLTDSSGNVIATTTTDSNGNYLFPNLEAGTYVINITPPAGYENTFDADGFNDGGSTYALADGENNRTQDFGLYAETGTIGNRVYHDENHNCEKDPGEDTFKDVEVELTWAGPDGEFGTDDDQSWITETDSDGYYEFTNLPPGKYIVDIDLGDNDLDGYAIHCDGKNNQNRANGIHQLVLEAGENYKDADFGFVKEEEKEKEGLVKTGTNMPLYALGTLLLLGGYGAYRMRRRTRGDSAL